MMPSVLAPFIKHVNDRLAFAIHKVWDAVALLDVLACFAHNAVVKHQGKRKGVIDSV
jgi:hypothetical protein